MPPLEDLYENVSRLQRSATQILNDTMVLDLKNYLISQVKSEYYSFCCTKIEVSTSKYTNADLTISLYVCIRIKIIP